VGVGFRVEEDSYFIDGAKPFIEDGEKHPKRIVLRALGALGQKLYSPGGTDVWNSVKVRMPDEVTGQVVEKAGRHVTDFDFATTNHEREAVPFLESKGFKLLPADERHYFIGWTMSRGRCSKFKLYFSDSKGNVLNQYGEVIANEKGQPIPGARGAPVLMDLFVRGFYMNHYFPFDRWDKEHPTLPGAELLFTKLQIVYSNEKDFIDEMVILREHEVADTDANKIVNGAYMGQWLSKEKDFYYTATTNLKRLRNILTFGNETSPINEKDEWTQFQKMQESLGERRFELRVKEAAKEEDRRKIVSRVDKLLEMIERESNGKLKNYVPGKRWYEKVEESI